MYTIKKIQDLFEVEIPRSSFIKAEETGSIPSPDRQQTGSVSRRMWSIEDLPTIGEKYGFLKKPSRPMVITVFTTKGGVLKTTLTLNIARMAALHNIRTIVIGLDLQGDVTSAIGFDNGLNEAETLEEAVSISSQIMGLNDFERGDQTLESIIQNTEIPTLDFIPETPELHQLDRAIAQKNKREYWLLTKIVAPLKEKYDLIIFDCSPNWNNLVTNAICACDLLISPIECKINNFRNYPSFKFLIDGFREDTNLSFKHIFIPTRLSLTRKLSTEIRQWYLANISHCLLSCIREGIRGEEAMTKHISVPEHAPGSLDAQEMRQSLIEIWKHLFSVKDRSQAKMSKSLNEAHTNINL